MEGLKMPKARNLPSKIRAPIGQEDMDPGHGGPGPHGAGDGVLGPWAPGGHGEGPLLLRNRRRSSSGIRRSF
ncbi:MAG: hypothetical protein DRG36_00320 [Deltaproteobacteria bacterium]|nr:MAG: hypothetical protein DRG36_00320 [Deltaproteobacteria bacterium]